MLKNVLDCLSFVEDYSGSIQAFSAVVMIFLSISVNRIAKAQAALAKTQADKDKPFVTLYIENLGLTDTRVNFYNIGPKALIFKSIHADDKLQNFDIPQGIKRIRVHYLTILPFSTETVDVNFIFKELKLTFPNGKEFKVEFDKSFGKRVVVPDLE